MKIKYTKRVMAFLMIIMMIMVSMPVSYANIYDAIRTSVAGSFNSVKGFGQVVMAESELGVETANLNSVNVFPNGAEVYVTVHGEEFGPFQTNQFVIGKNFDPNQDLVYGDDIKVEFFIPGTATPWPGGIDALIKQAHGKDEEVSLTNVVEFKFNAPYSGYDGEIKQLKAGEVVLSDNALLESIDPIPTVTFDSNTFEYTILVKSLDYKPTLNPIPVDPNARVEETIVSVSQTKVVVTAEDGYTTNTYIFNFVVRPAPVIVLIGDNPEEVLRSAVLPYSEPGATATNADSDVLNVSVDSSDVDRTTLGDYTTDYSTVDTVLVYDGNTQVYLEAFATRDVTVVLGNPPVITVIPGGTVFIGDEYNDPGATAADDEDGDLTDDINTDLGEVDTSVVGTFTVYYDVTDSQGNVATAEREVTVVNGNPPVITVLPGSVVYVNDVYDDPGATADDEEDGDLTEEINTDLDEVDTSEVGMFTVYYDVTDSHGNIAYASREVEVIAGNPPVITVIPGGTVYIGDDYVDPGATADDEEDGDLTEEINTDLGEVDTSVVGTFTVYYDVTDSQGNKATAERLVTVVNGNPPEITMLPGDTVYVGDTYVDPGATADDVEDGDLTDDIVADLGEVNTSEVGTFNVYYEVTDSHGNTVYATRIVEVEYRGVVIVDPPNYEIEADDIILRIGYGRTAAEGMEELEYFLQPNELEPYQVIWEVVDNDPDISLTTDGDVATVHGESAGEAFVKVTLMFGDSELVLSDLVKVTVIRYTAPNPPPPNPPVIGVTLDTDLVTLDYGEGADPEFLFYDFTETVTGTNDKRVTWSLDDDTYATVDENGVVTARDDIPVDTGEFTVVLTVTTVIGGATDTAEILFLEPTPLGAIEFYDPYVFGYPENIFGPQRFVTRAEVATMFAKILQMNLDFPGSQKFSDVSPDVWYYPYVQAIYRTKIFVGDGNGSFRPNDPISRAEIATVFSKLWEFTDIEVDDTAVLLPDVSASHWASSYIYKMYNSGMVGGFDDGTFRPNENTLRDQFVVMVNKLIDRPQYLAPFTKYVDIDPEYWAYGDIEAATQPFVVGNELLEE